REAANITCTVSGEKYAEFIDRFLVPSGCDPVLQNSGHAALDAPPGYLAFVIYPFLILLVLFDCLLFPWPVWPTVVSRSYLCSGLCSPGTCSGLVDLPEAFRGFGSSIFKASMLYISDWKSKFIFVREDLFSDQHLGIITPFRHHLEIVLYLAGLALSWEGSPLHPAIFVDVQGNRPVTFVAVTVKMLIFRVLGGQA
ncbi:hypothetical protein Tco_0756534, partial [Tanacetum coccineum]